LVWVDVEPNTRSPWSTTAVNNNAVIDGAIAGYKKAGVRVGIYSYGKAWKAITGARVLPTMPSWMPVGLTGRAEAQAACAVPSYIGSKPWLTQWTDDVRDYDLTCPGVTGRAESGNLLTPYLTVGLTSGSQGGAVTVLQRHLGAPKTGKFGSRTRAKVLALQRRHHLKASGKVGRAEWRALGAGTGSYTAPLPGFMDTLFAPT
jgi:peptidoglycan hydrolase-like protein with peptidoglycan-binding domain